MNKKLYKMITGDDYTYGKLIATYSYEGYPEGRWCYTFEGEIHIAGIYLGIDGKYYIDDGYYHENGMICTLATGTNLANADWNFPRKGGKRRRKTARYNRTHRPEPYEFPF